MALPADPIDSDPHAGQPVLTAGPPIAAATAAVILLQGRGGKAEIMLTLVDELRCPDCAYLAPQAADYTWYPYPFTTEVRRNQPHLSSALARIASLLEQLEQSGLPPERVALLGFSQGACLALEYAARNQRRYGGIIAFSGGLIGPPATQWPLTGSLQGTPVFLGCSDVDPYIPLERVHASAQVMSDLGAQVTTRIYPGMEHTINQDELEFARDLLGSLAGKAMSGS